MNYLVKMYRIRYPIKMKMISVDHLNMPLAFQILCHKVVSCLLFSPLPDRLSS